MGWRCFLRAWQEGVELREVTETSRRILTSYGVAIRCHSGKIASHDRVSATLSRQLLAPCLGLGGAISVELGFVRKEHLFAREFARTAHSEIDLSASFPVA